MGQLEKGMSEGQQGEQQRLDVFRYEDEALSERVERLALQHLTQFLVCKKVITAGDVDRAIEKTAKYCGVPGDQFRRPTPDMVSAIITRMNNALEKAADLRLVICLDEVHAEQVWSLCNGRADALSLAASSYSPEQMTALKKILDWSYTDDRRDHGAIAALTQQQLAMDYPVLAPNVITRMVNDGWLKELPPDYPGENSGSLRYTVGSRLLAEMSQYLSDTYGDDARTCMICGLPVLVVC